MKGVAKWLLRIVAAVALAVLLRGATLGIFVAGLYGTANWTDAWLDSAKPPRETVDRRTDTVHCTFFHFRYDLSLVSLSHPVT